MTGVQTCALPISLRILATFLAPSAGTAQILGRDLLKEADAVRHVIGYMPDFFGVYKDMEVTEYLDFFGACYKIPTAQREKTVNDVLELVGLTAGGALPGAISWVACQPSRIGSFGRVAPLGS